MKRQSHQRPSWGRTRTLQHPACPTERLVRRSVPLLSLGLLPPVPGTVCATGPGPRGEATRQGDCQDTPAHLNGVRSGAEVALSEAPGQGFLVPAATWPCRESLLASEIEWVRCRQRCWARPGSVGDGGRYQSFSRQSGHALCAHVGPSGASFSTTRKPPPSPTGASGSLAPSRTRWEADGRGGGGGAE